MVLTTGNGLKDSASATLDEVRSWSNQSMTLYLIASQGLLFVGLIIFFKLSENTFTLIHIGL